MGSEVSKPMVGNQSYSPSQLELCEICSGISFASDGIYQLRMRKVVKDSIVILEDDRDKCPLCSWIRTTVDERTDKQYLFDQRNYAIKIATQDSSLTVNFESPGPMFSLELFRTRCTF